MKESTFTKQKALVWVVSGAAVLGFAVGATGFASAATNSTDTTAPQIQLDASNAPQANGQPAGPAAGETALTGDVATSVTEAAQAAAPGATVDRVETDSSGHTYEAHVTLEDGTQKILFFNDAFEADGEETMPAGGPGHGGPGANETALTGDEATKVTEAALAAEPGATVDRVETDDVHAYEAHVTLADGTQKILFFNESFEADGEEVPPVGGPAHHGQAPDQNATTAPSTTTN